MPRGVWSVIHKMLHLSWCKPFLIEDSKLMMALCAFPSSCLDLLCRRHLCALHTYGYIHQLTVSLFSYGCPVPILLLKGTPESSGLPAPLLHVIFICLIKANLIKAGMAEMYKSSSEPRSWPDPREGLCLPTPRQQPAGRQVTQGSGQRGQAQERGSSRTS